MTYCSFARRASFSYVMKTSPRPATNALVAFRPDVSRETTFLNIRSTHAIACLSVFPSRRWAPYAAITFHFAAPEESGFGVTIPTPGFKRSLQFLIFFGLPSRTAKTTIEFVAMPLADCLFHFASTRPALTRSSMSSPVDSCTTSALRPAATARA